MINTSIKDVGKKIQSISVVVFNWVMENTLQTFSFPVAPRLCSPNKDSGQPHLPEIPPFLELQFHSPWEVVITALGYRGDKHGTARPVPFSKGSALTVDPVAEARK
ncbi:hypothetical protein AMECASPLE_031474 [Ameca splendens]|uniref:Uncharacterized protein n=1 Tax=Ameca splendens TaxID=208324 RepID=A0ABV0Y6Y8_9TELE